MSYYGLFCCVPYCLLEDCTNLKGNRESEFEGGEGWEELGGMEEGETVLKMLLYERRIYFQL